MSAIFFWQYRCECDRVGHGGHTDDFDAWCAGPRSMDNCTEQALAS